MSNTERNHTWLPLRTMALELPLFESVAAGFPSPAEDYLDKGLDLNEYCIRNPSSTFLLRVQGDSMTNAGIFDRDVVVVDRSLAPRHNDIVVAFVDGEFTIKRLAWQGKQLFLVAENEHFAPLQVSQEAEFSVWGVVTMVLHRLSGRQ